MINYDAGYLGVNPNFLFKATGSVALRTLAWAIPNGVIGSALWFFWDWMDDGKKNPDSASVSQMLGSYNFVLGFLVIFRVQLAYERFWSACICTHELRATWFSAASSLVAFVSFDEDKSQEINKFFNILVRLVSLIHQAACERLDYENQGAEYLVLDTESMEQEAKDFLQSSCDRCEIIEQWLEKLVVQNMRNGVLPIPPPIISRVFGDFSQGILLLGDLEVYSDFPLPFPFAQMTAILLLFHFFITPIIASLIMYNWRWAGVFSFTMTFCLWALNYIAMEIERPFGKTKNCLPGPDLQNEMNRACMLLMEKRMQMPPKFEMTGTGISYMKKVEHANNSEKNLRRTATQEMVTQARESLTDPAEKATSFKGMGEGLPRSSVRNSSTLPDGVPRSSVRNSRASKDG